MDRLNGPVTVNTLKNMKSGNTGMFNKVLKFPGGAATLQQMYRSLSPEDQLNFANRDNILKAMNVDTPLTEAPEDLLGTPEMLKAGVTPQFASNDPGLGDVGALTLSTIKNHPFKTAGLGILGAGNIGGLTDNNKFGGQLGGLALGGLGSYMMGANPYTAAMMTLGGGELGALFDKLRAKKEQVPQNPYGGR